MIKEEKDVIWLLREELEWVDDSSEVKCTGCKQLLVFCCIASCGHRFCSVCKGKFEIQLEDFVCPLPVCSRLIWCIVSHLDQEFEEKLATLSTYCPNRMFGCLHICQLQNIPRHLFICSSAKDNILATALREVTSIKESFNNISADMRGLEQKTNDISKEVVDGLGEMRAEVENQSIEVNRLSVCGEASAKSESACTSKEQKRELRLANEKKLEETNQRLTDLVEALIAKVNNTIEKEMMPTVEKHAVEMTQLKKKIKTLSRAEEYLQFC